MLHLKLSFLLALSFWLPCIAGGAVADNPGIFWRQNLVTAGKAAFNSDTSFKVFRNVKDYGAKGDGSTDDTASIQNALSSGTGRTFTSSTTVSPVVLYFPPGTYMISKSIQLPYYTQMIGSAIAGTPSTIKVVSGWPGDWMLDADPYQSNGQLGVGATNNFYKEIRNLNLDLSASTRGGAAIHWPASQATLLQGITITMSTASNNQQVGIYCEAGSGGFMSDITFNGGNIGLNIGNQQFLSRGLTFNGCSTAINQIWSWEHIYQGITISNCGVGIDMTGGGPSNPSVSSVSVIDSVFTNTPIGIKTIGSSSISPPTAGTLLIDNTQFTNSPSAVVGQNNVVQLNAGSSMLVSSWASGRAWAGSNTNYTYVQGSLSPPPKAASTLSGGKILARSRPDYAAYSSDQFISVKAAGAKGDGSTDDTAVLRIILNSYCANKIVFFDAGAYIVTDTIQIPAGCWIVGEGESVIMASGAKFQDQSNPRVVLQVGQLGDTAATQISGLMLSNQGGIAGAIMLQWNINDSSGNSGIWTTHFRLGGASGTNQLGNCPTQYSASSAASCSGAFLKFHVRGSGYFENMWIWTADHQLDGDGLSQISIYTGRGLLIESTGPTVFLAVASEHCSIYMYQVKTQAPVVMVLLQSETPYYQPSPVAPTPFAVNSAYDDPTFPSDLQSAYALRVLNTPNLLVYGAGLYSFFSDYSTSCISTLACQTQIVSVENSTPYIYDLGTIGSKYALHVNGQPVIPAAEHSNTYPDIVVAYAPSALTAISTTSSITSTRSSSTSTSSSVATSTSSTRSASTTSTSASPSSTSRTMTTPSSASSSSQSSSTINSSATGRSTTSSSPSSSPASTSSTIPTNSRTTSSITSTTSSTSSAPASSTTWTSLGCVSDGSSRALTFSGFTSDQMTVELCQARCAAAGQPLSGVEYSKECYCGSYFANNLGQPLTSDKCNMACAGNAQQSCGGGYALNAYQNPSVGSPSSVLIGANTYSKLGCYSDNYPNSRYLAGVSSSGNSTMTVRSCLTYCYSSGYAFAGMEYSNECYCANALDSGSKLLDPNSCNSLCAGNSGTSSEICGGSNALLVYQASQAAASTSSSTRQTTASSSTSPVSSTTTRSSSSSSTTSIPSSTTSTTLRSSSTTPTTTSTTSSTSTGGTTTTSSRSTLSSSTLSSSTPSSSATIPTSLTSSMRSSSASRSMSSSQSRSSTAASTTLSTSTRS